MDDGEIEDDSELLRRSLNLKYRTPNAEVVVNPTCVA